MFTGLLATQAGGCTNITGNGVVKRKGLILLSRITLYRPVADEHEAQETQGSV